MRDDGEGTADRGKHVRSLAFDSSGTQCAVALWVDGHLAAQAVRPARHGHAELLAPMIAELLGRCAVPAGRLNRVAVTRGPGGFTGVRVGLATARGLALATGAGIYGITTFSGILLSVGELIADDGVHDCVMVVVDSRLEAVFVQVFSPGLAPLTEPEACDPARLSAVLPLGLSRPIVVGDIADKAATALEGSGVSLIRAICAVPDAAALARAGASCPEALLGPPMPLYIVPPKVGSVVHATGFNG